MGLHTWVHISHMFARSYGLKLYVKQEWMPPKLQKPGGVTWSRGCKVLAVLGK